jgi:hypothetical protein
MAYSMTASCSKFCRGFLQGSLLGFVLLIIGLLSWGIAILVGVEKDTSLGGFSLASLYVLSFGLGGSAVVLLRKGRPRWYESIFAWAAATVIVLLGCGVMALLLESGRPIEWFWGAGSTTVLCLLLGASLVGRWRSAELCAAQNGGPGAPNDNSNGSERPPSVS